MAQREITEADVDVAMARPEAQYRARTHSDRTVMLGKTLFGGCLKVVVCTNEPSSVITVEERTDDQSRSTGTRSASLFAEHDPESGTSYVWLSEAPVAGTLLHISDVIMVDVDDDGTPAGVEVVAPLDTIERGDWYALAKVVPEVNEIFKGYFPA